MTSTTINSLRGEYTSTLAGERFTFDTTLGTIACIEEACGGRSITDVLATVVGGRRAADQLALLGAALKAGGHDEAAAAHATLPEAEAFILALMGALGFRLAPREEGEAAAQNPLAESDDGGTGASSRSAA